MVQAIIAVLIGLIASLWFAWLVFQQAQTLPLPYTKERIHLETYLKALLVDSARVERILWDSLLGVAYGDWKGRIIDANDAFATTLGYTREELIRVGLNWRQLTPESYRHLDEQTLEQMRGARLVKPVLKEYFRKDGSRVPVAVGGVVLPRAGKTVTLVLDLSAPEPVAA
jgi:PAS domain S-box-containing protein